MQCTNCGETIPTRKSLQTGKAAGPDECPDCGATLEKSTGMDGDLIQK